MMKQLTVMVMVSLILTVGMVDDVYYTTHSKPKADVVLLKLDSGDASFADTSINGTPFKFLMDSGVSKCVVS